MNLYVRRKSFVSALMAVVAVVLLSGGCKDDKPKVDIMQLEGKVEKVKVGPDGTGEITIVYFSERHDQDMVGTGLVNKQTEITINGVVSPLSEIRVGERVRGEVRVEKKGEQKEQVALKIYVDRVKPVGGTE